MILLAKNAWEVKETKNKGRDLFAKKDIRAGVVVGDYLGRVMRTAEVSIEGETNLYLMYYHDKASIYPDLQKAGIHLLNHSCTPNTWIYVHQGHTLFFALRHIFSGEEITTSYMLSPKDEFCNPCPHVCKCASPMCTGSMHLPSERYAKWDIFQKEHSKKSRRKRIRYNKSLAPLSVYPKKIPDHPIYNLFGYVKGKSVVCEDKDIPKVNTLRSLIREKGRMVDFPNLNLKVYGVIDNKVISEALTTG